MIKVCFVIVSLVSVIFVQAQSRQTIPEAIANGAVGSVATAPSGPTPTVDELLRNTDLIVIGTVGEARGYLSKDQRDVLTDYKISEPKYFFQAEVPTTSTPGTLPSVAVTLRGGTVVVNGVQFTQKEPGLLPLKVGSRALFLLRHVGDKYEVAGTFFGAFEIANGRLLPLSGRSEFAPELRDALADDAASGMAAVARAKRGAPIR